MTSLLINGYFALGHGRRVSSENPTTHKTTHHVLYDTVIQSAGVDIPAEIRTWAPANEPLLPDGTVADVLGKLFAPPNATAWIDVVQMSIFPGDVTDAEYENKVPDRPFPTVFVLGHTSGSAETMDDTVSVGYFVQTSEYVRDQARASRVYCRFDGSKPRWKKTPRPQSGAAVFVVGLAHGIHLSGGTLQLDVDQVQLNVGSTVSMSSATPAKFEVGTGTSAKRRRFAISATKAKAAPAADGATTVLPGPAPAATDAAGPPEGDAVASEPPAADDDGEDKSSTRTTPAKGKRVAKRKMVIQDDGAEGQ